jgi:hypothetical protein
MESPARLYRDFCGAVEALYGQASNVGLPNQHAANDWLTQFQSRNLKRNLQSMRGKEVVSLDRLPLGCGSTAWACITVLLNSESSVLHKTLASQTLVHRMRRMKLVEAIDMEMELVSSPQDCQELLQATGQLNGNEQVAERILQFVKEVLSQISPLTLSILQSTQLVLTEESAKGQIMIHTILVIVFQVAQASPHETSLLASLSTFLSLVALKMRQPSMLCTLREAIDRVYAHVHSTCSPSLYFYIASYVAANLPEEVLSPHSTISIHGQELKQTQIELYTSGSTYVESWLSNEGPLECKLAVLQGWSMFILLSQSAVEKSAAVLREALSATQYQELALKCLAALVEMNEDDDITDKPKSKQSGKSEIDHQHAVCLSDLQQRGRVACQVVAHVWDSLVHLPHSRLFWTTLTSLSRTCLVYMVKSGDWDAKLAGGLTQANIDLCSHADPSVRLLSLDVLSDLCHAMEGMDETSAANQESIESIVQLFVAVSTMSFGVKMMIRCTISYIYP